MIIVGDLESDELLDKITKIYCFCYTDIETGEERNLITYEDIISLFQTPNLVWIGHNIQRYDVPAIEKIFGTKELAKQAANEVVREWWSNINLK